MLNLRTTVFIVLAATLQIAPVLAEANFGQIVLNADTKSAQASGNTQGAYDLTRIATKDMRGNDCLGWATENPDHEMVLEEDLKKLELKVNSRGKDTTLVVKGPAGILCGDDAGASPDAAIEAENLPAGTYQVWVGAIQPNQSWNYSLSARGQ